MASLFLGTRPDGAHAGSGERYELPSARLTRHAVCFGMTGSGKTGLGVVLLEELAASGVPILAIDPKGDLANLALAFRGPTADDLAPWVDAEEARRNGRDAASHAAAVAERARTERIAAGLDAARVARFVDGVEVTVHSPGSAAGAPVNVLGTLGAPPEGLDAEDLAALVTATSGSLLGLLGIAPDPLRDPRHILVAKLLGEAWERAEPVDLERLIVQIVDPPFEKVGVFPTETFLPRTSRLDLAMQLNALLASPAFSPWGRGEALDLDRLLARGERTPLRVFWLAHLEERQRHFFLTLLLSRLVAWARRQPGTGELRAVLYFDEVMGYLPPHPANPATKGPILTLLKQARAVGLGVVLCTQNPVDVDYKALGNAGTWFIGRLSTSHDRDRVLDGLQGAMGAIDRATLVRTIDALPPRTFVVRDVEEAEPTLLRTRWAISHLRGPLTRREVERLGGPATVPPANRPELPGSEGLKGVPPPAPQGYRYRFLRPDVAFSARLAACLGERARARRPDGRTVYEPAVLATLHLTFDEGPADRGFRVHRAEQRLFFPLDPEPVLCGEPTLEPADLSDDPVEPAWFGPLPAHLDESAELRRLEKEVVEAIPCGETERMFVLPALKLSSHGGETAEAFRTRAERALLDRADAELVKLHDKADRELKRLEAKLVDLQGDLAAKVAEQRSKVAAEVVNAGETLFSMFFGTRRKSLSTAVTKRNATRATAERIARIEEQIRGLEHEMYELTTRTAHEVAEIRNRALASLDEIEERPVRLERNDIRLDDFVVLWIPVTRPV